MGGGGHRGSTRPSRAQKSWPLLACAGCVGHAMRSWPPSNGHNNGHNVRGAFNEPKRLPKSACDPKTARTRRRLCRVSFCVEFFGIRYGFRMCVGWIGIFVCNECCEWEIMRLLVCVVVLRNLVQWENTVCVLNVGKIFDKKIRKFNILLLNRLVTSTVILYKLNQ